MLNQRQELFCQYMLQGKAAGEAARLAGYSQNTAYSIGPHLLKNVEICKRLTALQTTIAEGNIASISERKEILTKIAKGQHKEPMTARERVQAIAELNKMEGDYAPDKHAVLGDIEITIIHRDKGG